MLIFRVHLTYFMKYLLTSCFVVILWLAAVGVYAQDLSGPKPDDEFNVFLLAVAIAFFSIIIGATLAGSMLVTLVLVGLFGLVSAGIVSAGVLVGLYKRSITSGFKTVLAIVCSITGILIGAVSFFLINRFYEIHLSGVAATLIGGFSGLMGGLLLGLVLYTLIRLFLNYCRQKLSF